MFENDKIICVDIDPIASDPFEVLSDFRSQWEKDPSYKGFRLWVEQGADVHFWNMLSDIIPNMIKDLPIDHLIIKIDFRNRPQDVSKILLIPFCEKLKTISIEGQLSTLAIENLFRLLVSNKALKSFRLADCRLSMEEIMDLLAKLNTCEPLQLENFSLNGSELNSNFAMSLIEKLSLHAVHNLDLIHNSIYCGEGNKAQIYDYFCEAINESTVDTLALSSVGDAEAKILSESLSKVSRPFILNISVMRGLTTIGIKHFIDAVETNPNLRVMLDDVLDWVKSTPEGLALQAASQKNIPSLFHLAARVVSRHAAIYSDDDLKELPSDCLAVLPVVTGTQYKLRREIADQRESALETALEENATLSALERIKIVNEIDEAYKDKTIAALRELKLN
jgi:hypothetical protein